MDGILNNDAYKHTTGDAMNETWTQLLIDFKVFDDMDDHIMYLRRRFVLGAADWMAGKNDSMQNDKLLFDYTDAEWEIIWMTMLEDGAWAVPNIQDEDGNSIKENNAPEIMIKFMAHDLKSNIIVFDLQLNIIQFISGNLLKSDNVAFESPLLLYATGSHFQSVMQEDHEFFVNLSKDLEANNHAGASPQLASNVNVIVQEPNAELLNEHSKIMTSNKKPMKIQKKPVKHKPTQTTELTKNDNPTEKEHNRSFKTEKKSKVTKHIHESKDELETKNMFSDLPILDNDGNDTFDTYEAIKSIKPAKRTNEQKMYFERIKKQKLRKKETAEEIKIRNTKNKEAMKGKRSNETPEETESRNIKKKEHIRKKRSNESTEQEENRQIKNKTHMKKCRLSETAAERSKRCLKNKENMRILRSNHSQLKRLQRFQDSVRYGPIFTCTVCEQDMFKNSVVVLTDKFEEEVRTNSSELFKKVLINKHRIELKGELHTYICGTCKRHLKKGNLPAMAAANGLAVFPIPDQDLNLTELENNLIAKRLMFQKIYQLPKSRMAACKDRLINIPISSNDVVNTLQNLPRTPQEAGLLEVKLKRKLEYKNTHQQAYIDPKKIYKALEFLKSSGHPDYQFFDNYRTYQKRCFHTKLEFVNDDLIATYS